MSVFDTVERITKRRERILAFIADHWEAEGYSPSVDDMTIEVGYSDRTVESDLRFMVQEGRLERFQHYRGWRIPDEQNG